MSTPQKQAESALIAELVACLQDAVEDSEEVLAVRLMNYGENYRPERLKAMREQITKARAVIARATGA